MLNIQEQIEKLRLLKRHYDLEYWRESCSSHSDEIYDQIKNKLEKLLEENPKFRVKSDDELESVYMNTFAAVTHKYKMMSLGKVFSVDELFSWLKSKIKLILNSVNNALIFEFKIDGFAISLEYENGILLRASTRGDGKVGNDMTPTVYLIPDIPNKLKTNFTGEIAGEIYMKKSSLKKLNEKLVQEGKEPLKNVRNAASGIARQKDASTKYAEYLSFLCYKYNNDNKQFENYIKEMSEAKFLGFHTVFHDLNGIIINDIERLASKTIEGIFNTFKNKRDDLDLDIDGVVIKINNKDVQEKLKDNGKVPNWSIAYKFPAQEKITTLLDVEWDFGIKDGRFTPMAVIEPVEIGGTIVKRPTLHNLEEIKRLGVKIGCSLIVSRRGDVIPKVEEVIQELMPSDAKEIEIPTICPYCGQPLVIDGAYLKCINHDCSGRLYGRIMSFIQSMSIDSFGPKLVDKLIETNKLKSVVDIYKLKAEDISSLDRAGDKLANKIINNIEKSKSNPMWKIIAGLSIKDVGEKTAKLLENNLNTLQDIKYLTKDKLLQLNDIGETSANNILNWINEVNIGIIDELSALGLGCIKETIEVANNKLNGLKIAFTGKLESFTRKECEDIIKQNGGEVWAIKKELDILLIGSGAKQHKIEKAKSLGANVITEEEFLVLIE